jgi:putative transposase
VGYAFGSLDPKSTAPKGRRKRVIPDGVEDFILKERAEHSKLGKKKLATLLAAEGITISVSKIGRIIRTLKDRGLLSQHRRMSVSGATGRVIARKEPAHKPKQRLKDFRPSSAGDLIESDFAFAYAYKTLSSATALDFLRKLLGIVPFAIRRIQTDNGSEFAKHFREELVELGIPHFHTYPRTPKMNAFIERFNRTIQEEFAYGHRATLAHYIVSFNEKLIEWLIWYDTKRPHHSLGLLSPMQYLMSTLTAEESQRLWTSTSI